MVESPSLNVTLCDSFWSPRLETNARRTIYHQWAQLEASGCIDNFRILAGGKVGFREGWFFADSDAYKWLDAAARIEAHWPDERLEALMEQLIGLLARCQAPDGYLFTYNQIHFPGQRWVNLQIEHELYCHGHLIEGCVSYFQAYGRHGSGAGEPAALEMARKAADLLVLDFLGADPQYTPGHEEIEIALLRLYELIGHAPYLELARHFLEQRGRAPFFALSLLRQNSRVAARRKQTAQMRQVYIAEHPGQAPFSLPADNYAKRPPFGKLRWAASALSGKYFQQHAPIRRQTAPVGHAVRFGYLETACAMLQRLQPEVSLLPAMGQAWERMVSRRMYVTGGLGSLSSLEGFGRDYELDPEFAYAETCAALASIFWNWEMARITRHAKYSDLLEWQLYNAASVGMGLDGESYLYNNPLACRSGITRKAWYAVPCCPSNLSRTWADLGRYIFSMDGAELWIHQYIACRARLDLGMPVQVEIESQLPWNGLAWVIINPERTSEFTIHLRLPSWSASPAIVIRDGQSGQVTPLELSVPGDAQGMAKAMQPAAQGYDPRGSHFLAVRRLWSPGDRIELAFDLPIELRRAHPRVKGHAGKAALTRGSLVYCLESLDNPDLDIFTVRLDPGSLKVEQAPDLLGGITILKGSSSEGRPLIFIPYQLWANRDESQMTVWVNLK